MSKKALVEAMANDSFTATEADRAIAAVGKAIRAVTARGDDVRIAGLGTFRSKDKPARTGRNPQTGLPVEIAAKTVLTFKEGKAS